MLASLVDHRFCRRLTDPGQRQETRQWSCAGARENRRKNALESQTASSQHADHRRPRSAREVFVLRNVSEFAVDDVYVLPMTVDRRRFNLSASRGLFTKAPPSWSHCALLQSARASLPIDQVRSSRLVRQRSPVESPGLVSLITLGASLGDRLTRFGQQRAVSSRCVRSLLSALSYSRDGATEALKLKGIHSTTRHIQQAILNAWLRRPCTKRLGLHARALIRATTTRMLSPRTSVSLSSHIKSLRSFSYP